MAAVETDPPIAVSRRETLPTRPEIDGLRAVAVLGVVCFHAAFGLEGGYTGVDVFFVISGFLITSLILRDLEAGTFSLVRFWERRIRRIAPPLLLMQAVVLAAGFWLFLPDDLVQLSKATIAQIFFLGNVFAWRDTGYFAVASDLKPHLHMWSLAVEEQFYLFFPFLMLALFPWGRRRAYASLVVLMCLSLVLCVVTTPLRPGAAFFLLPTRAWELLVGCVLAFHGRDAFSRAWRECMSWGGMALIGAAMVLFTKATPFPGIAALAPVAGAALVIAGNQQDLSTVGRLLASAPCVTIGRFSYGLYLWHWPLFAFSRYVNDAPPSFGARVALVALSLLLAAMSQHFLEEPIRRSRVLPGRSGLLRAFGTTTAGLLAVAGGLWADGGCENRIPPLQRIEHAGRDELAMGLPEAEAGRFPMLGDPGHQDSPTFILWGDSHAMMAAEAFDTLGRRFSCAGLAAIRPGTPPLPGLEIEKTQDSARWNAAVLAEIRRRNIQHVFLVARWASYLEGATPYEASMRGLTRGPQIVASQDSNGHRQRAELLFLDSLRALCQELVGQDIRVYIVMQPPDQSCYVLRRAFVACRTHGLVGTEDRRVTMQEHRQRVTNAARCFENLVAEFPTLRVLDGTVALEDDHGRIDIFRDSRPLYFDDNHLTPMGFSLFLGTNLLSVFQGLVDRPSS